MKFGIFLSFDFWHSWELRLKICWLGTWKEGEEPANNNSGVSNSQWTAFSPVESPAAEVPPNTLDHELDEEHSSSDEDVDRSSSSSPELAGEEGEVLLR